MRRPNGYGTIYKLTGKRRKPFAVRVTKGKERKLIGTYATRQEAEARLVEYNQGFVDLKSMGISFKEVKELWEKEHYPTIGKSTIQGYEAAFKHFGPLHDRPFEDVRHQHLQAILDGTDRSYSTKSTMRALVSQMYKHALVNDVVLKDYSEALKVGKKEESDLHKPFTEDEIRTLFKAQALPYIDLVLIQIHTGLRSNELLGDLKLHKGYLMGGSKTKAGKNRIVPLHKNIERLVMDRYKRHGKLLEEELTPGMYRYRFVKALEELDMDHLPHDCRHTFATIMNRTQANQLAVRRILGHAGSGVTEKTYTHKDIEDLKEAVGYFPDFSFKAPLSLAKAK